MRTATLAPRGRVATAAAIALAGLLGACAGEPSTPAPVIIGGEQVPMGGMPGAVAPRHGWAPPPRAAEGQRIVVRPGQSLSRIAVEYHVSEHAIIAANHLQPPYKIEIGQHLVIPGAAGPPPRELAASDPLPPVGETGHPPPEIISLDGPARPLAPAAAATLRPPAGEPSAADEARAEAPAAVAARPEAPLPHGGHLPWPVEGRILAGYGAEAGGTHNDGINIAAPKGAPVRAVDAGVVAYAGNELRGYGNLVLVKHPSGFISAYAHCEELLVKRGDKVARGQVIARVGATGGVREPQLHFELRRGKSAVDPRRFLGPAPAAEARAAPHPG